MKVLKATITQGSLHRRQLAPKARGHMKRSKAIRPQGNEHHVTLWSFSNGDLLLVHFAPKATRHLEIRNATYQFRCKLTTNSSWTHKVICAQNHPPPKKNVPKVVTIRRIRYIGLFRWCNIKQISDVLCWTPTHRCASVCQPARIYIYQLCAGTECSLEDLPEAKSIMTDEKRVLENSGQSWFGFMAYQPLEVI